MTTRTSSRRVMVALLMLAACISPLTAQNRSALPASSASPTTQAHAEQSLDRQGSVFIENRGQWDSRARFLLRSAGLDLWITDSGVVYDIHRVERSAAAASTAMIADSREMSDSRPIVHRTAVFMSFLGASTSAAAEGTTRSDAHHNYFIGNDSSKWVTNVPLYHGARIEKLYEGIDALFYLDAGRPRYDLIVAPGADPSQVAMGFDGAEAVRIDETGSLVIGTVLGDVRQRELYAYQMRDGRREQVRCAFVQGNDGSVRFDIGSYDRNRALVIDPVVMVYSTYLGGSSLDEPGDITADSTGNVYITGYTLSPDFPVLTPHQASLAVGPDVFVTKLATDGSLTYSTYLGGNYDDRGDAIAIDASGNAYITGRTWSRNFPVRNPIQASFAGSADSVWDGFVTKLTASGALSYSTYLGGSEEDYGTGIAVDASGNAYVTGRTESMGFPVLNPLQASLAAGPDAFVTKLTTDGTLSYSTYLGGNSSDEGSGIAVDAGGNVYITGITSSTDFPVLNPVQASRAANYDLFVTKLSASGDLLYSTYFGGDGPEYETEIAVDVGSNVYVTGWTTSTSLPLLNPMQASSASNREGFVMKLTASGDLSYSTYLGGGGDDFPTDIAVDANGYAYITGRTESMDLPLLNPVQASHGNTGAAGRAVDAFVTRLATDGSLSFSTYLGGSSTDEGEGIAVDASGNAYVAGWTTSTDFPLLNPQQANKPGSWDVFVTKYAVGTASVPSHATPLRMGLSPNPVSSELSLAYTLLESLPVSLEIHAGDGRLIATPLTNERQEAGNHLQRIDMRSLPSGVYTLRLIAGKSQRVERFIVVR